MSERPAHNRSIVPTACKPNLLGVRPLLENPRFRQEGAHNSERTKIPLAVKAAVPVASACDTQVGENRCLSAAIMKETEVRNEQFFDVEGFVFSIHPSGGCIDVFYADVCPRIPKVISKIAKA